MKTNLEILIDELQAECDLLQEELNFCIYDSDFEGAHAFNKSLNYTRNQLQIIRNIENPNWTKIEEYKRRIQQLEKLKEDSPFYKMMIKRLPEYQVSLDELLAIPPKKYALEGEQIPASLEALLKGEIRKITLQMNDDNAEIHFKLIEKILNLHLIIQSKFADKNRRYAILKNMGFEIEQDNNMSMQIADFNSSKISNVLEILALIIYDVLGLSGNEKAQIIIL